MKRLVFLFPAFALVLLLSGCCCKKDAFFASPVPKGDIYATTFRKGEWDKNKWFPAKSPRWDYMGTMVQFDDHIMNRTPELSDDVIFRKYASKVYSNLMYKEKLKMNVTISSVMSFDHRMAPEILITGALGKSAKGEDEHRDHYEIVLFDQGLNVWHHTYRNGKPGWYKAAYLKAKFLPKKKYEVVVRMEKTAKGKQMIVSCDGKTFGYMDNNLPETFYAGVVGCEGRCRFYDFKISKK